MVHKRTYFHRDFAIVHRTFASEQTEEIVHLYIVNRVGDPRQVAATTTLDDAKRAIDELAQTQRDAKSWAQELSV
jgi:hypothetical protein